jgi:hypothetical protein
MSQIIKLDNFVITEENRKKLKNIFKKNQEEEEFKKR